MNELFMTYLDFELEIGTGRGRQYPVAVTHSPAGEAHATMHFPYDALSLEKRLAVLQNALLDSGGGFRHFPSPEELVVRNFGRDLFDALFTGQVRQCFEQSIEQAWQEDKGICLKLHLQPPDLAALPWEFLYDPRQAEYVCLSRNTPLVRYLELPHTVPPLSLSPPLRILGMIASPDDLTPLNEAREKEQVETALQSLRARGLVELTWLEGRTWRHLHEAMQDGDWHIFHFLGQGDFSRRDRFSDKGFLALAGEEGEIHRLSAADLARLLTSHPSLRVVLLNARQGAQAALLRNIYTNTATLLVREGIPAVLATPYQITDEAAIKLFRVFYEALALGIPVGAALAGARNAINFAIANTLEWGAPALFMGAPDGLVFSPPGADQTQVEEEPFQAAVSVETPEEMSVPVETPEEMSVPVETPKEMPAPVEATGEVQLPVPVEVPAEVQTPLPIKPPMEVLEPEPAPAVPSRPTEGPSGKPGPKPEPPARAPQPLEPELVLIPAGEFLMGSDPEKDRRAYENEQPQQRVYLPGYHIGRTPVTNAQYAAFVEASGYKPPKHWVDRKLPDHKEDYPVVYISWDDAMAYCRWLSKKNGQAYRLPSEAEWEKAARGTEGRIYPWGDAWELGRCNSNEGGRDDTTRVDAYLEGASPYGILDMAGNMWEWTGSLYRPYPYNPNDGREDPKAFGKRVLRGGAFYSGARRVRCAYRDSGGMDDWRGSYGFRVCVVPWPD
jgi:formylglycine-generating enzyme required for sulfatase activity